MNKARIELFNLFEKDSAYNASNGLWCYVNVGFATNWDLSSAPPDYIFLREGVSEIGSAYGDGKSHKRKSDCDIMIVSSGMDSSELRRLDNEVARLLNEIPYVRVNLGYDDKLKQSQITYAITLEV